jgi:multisubunit Na+/H+ antiporter MnhF subunit
MTIEGGGWRALAAGELAAEPDARFGGMIAAIFFAALFALTPLVFLAVSGARDAQGTTWVLLMMLRQAFRGDMTSAYMALSMAQMLALLVWAATFVAVTLVGARSGPTMAAVVFAIAALAGPVGQCAIIVTFAADTGGIFQAAAQLPHMVLNLVGAVAFWAYMHEGRRPNLYFRRRVRVTAVAGAVA